MNMVFLDLVKGTSPHLLDSMAYEITDGVIYYGKRNVKSEIFKEYIWDKYTSFCNKIIKIYACFLYKMLNYFALRGIIVE